MKYVKEACEISSLNIDDAYDKIRSDYLDELAINSVLEHSIRELLTQISALRVKDD